MDLQAHIAPSPEGTSSILLIGPLDSRRRALRSILSPPHWYVREASTYAEAVGILDNCRIGVAICDTEVPDGNWQALLRNLQGRTRPPILIISSRLADERLWAEVLNLGGYDVLVQPFDRSEVLRVAGMAWMSWRQRCQGRSGEAPRALQVAAAS
jgi:DNA-binding response OmpR family regulator